MTILPVSATEHKENNHDLGGDYIHNFETGLNCHLILKVTKEIMTRLLNYMILTVYNPKKAS